MEITTKDQALEFLSGLVDAINAQDNRSTAMPYYFVVRQEKWRVVHPEYHSGETRSVRVDFRGDPTTFHNKAEFIEWATSYYGDEFDGKNADVEWDKLDKFVEEQYFEESNVFFTEKGYQEHMRLNEHNLKRGCTDVHSYVRYATRNPEIKNLLTSVAILCGKELKNP